MSKNVRLSFEVTFGDDIYQKLEAIAIGKGFSTIEEWLHSRYDLTFHDPLLDVAKYAYSREIEVKVCSSGIPWEYVEEEKADVIVEPSSRVDEETAAACRVARHTAYKMGAHAGAEIRWNWADSSQGHYIGGLEDPAWQEKAKHRKK